MDGEWMADGENLIGGVFGNVFFLFVRKGPFREVSSVKSSGIAFKFITLFFSFKFRFEMALGADSLQTVVSL